MACHKILSNEQTSLFNRDGFLVVRGLISLVGSSVISVTAFADIERPAATNMVGFTPANAANQRALETKFDDRLDPADQRAWLERMSAEPNHVGSPHNKANAEFMLEKFREWGWEAQIETFYVLYPTPKKQALEMVAPTRFTARLHEPAVAGDRTSARTAEALPPYDAYGADGDVAVGLADVIQAGDSSEVDDRLRLGQPQFHRRDQTVPARQHLRVFAVPAQQADRFVECPRLEVFESGRNHSAGGLAC